jgi:hypothetical protein
MRLPVAAKIALVNAGAKGGTPGSPTPLGGVLGPGGRCRLGHERSLVDPDHREVVKITLSHGIRPLSDVDQTGLEVDVDSHVG